MNVQQAVTGIVRISGPGTCTGTLIAQNLVLTAAHCFDQATQCNYDGGQYPCPGHNPQIYSGKITIRLDNQTAPGFVIPHPEVQASPQTVFIHPRWMQGENSMAFFDLAVVRLTEASGERVLSRKLFRPLRVPWKDPTNAWTGAPPTGCTSTIDSQLKQACNWVGHTYFQAGYGCIAAGCELGLGQQLPVGKRPIAFLGMFAAYDLFGGKYDNAALIGLDATGGFTEAAPGDSGSAAIVGTPVKPPDALEKYDWLYDEPSIVAVYGWHGQGGRMTYARMTAQYTKDWFTNQRFLDMDEDGIPGHQDLCPIDPSNGKVDPDDDGLNGTCDNCPTVSNIYQWDADHDGLGDACDPCPDGSGPNTDIDGDGWADACPTRKDNCPLKANPDQKDDDHDGVGDLCDACPGGDDHVDTDHDGLADHCDLCDGTSDADGDGKGDACDLCPCDTTGTNDPDGDGICTQWTPGLPSKSNLCLILIGSVSVDNCPSVRNENQKNDNVVSEVVRQAAPMGNACDPVPVPITKPKFTWFYPAASVVQNDLDSLALEPIGSHSTGFAGTTVPAGDERAVWVPSTAYRYCHRSPLYDVRCFKNDEAVGDGWLTHNGLVLTRAAETGFSWWHRVTMDRYGVTIPPDGNDTAILFQTGKSYPRTWKYQDDWSYWAAHFFAWPNLPIPETEGGKLGRFWLHANTGVGMTDLTKGTGAHFKQGLLTPADELANYYLDLDPSRRTRLPKFEPKMADWKPGWYFAYRACATCPPYWNGRSHYLPFESQVIVENPAQPGEIGVLVPGGIYALDTAEVGPGLRASLSDTSLRWLDAAEPNPMVGRGGSAPEAIALSADGTIVSETVLLRDGKLLGLADLIRDPIHGPVAGASAQSVTPAAPSPRVQFGAAYSRALGRLFLVGGTDSTSHEPTREVWTQSLDDRLWKRVATTGYEPETVLATTYSTGDGRLWVLDERAFGPVRIARLARIDPVTGKHETVGAWPRLRLFDRHWLVVDRDGSVLVAASSAKLRKHMIVRVRVDAPHPRVGGVYVGGFEITGPPVVDEEGYWLIGFSRAGGPRVERLTDLKARPGDWGDVGGCL
jgi:hypothetical protein